TSNKGAIIHDVQEKLGLLTRLIRAYAKGEYRQLPWKSVVLTVAVLIYFVSPIDVIPDLLPIIGFTDDIALLIWLFRTISNDLDTFKVWEAEQVVPLDPQEATYPTRDRE
ncbi:YkvA family protein, partial [Siphonobacter sp.]|uniref:YkvA family protein n=1 Tax=Siphonobacter sp. TaxID=1869184 RepID=UPI003B3B7B30